MSKTTPKPPVDLFKCSFLGLVLIALAGPAAAHMPSFFQNTTSMMIQPSWPERNFQMLPRIMGVPLSSHIVHEVAKPEIQHL